MSLRDRFVALLTRGSVDETPDQLVELIRLPLHQGPLTLRLLRDDGFAAVGEEAFNVVTRSVTDYRILVPRRELTAAETALNS